MGNGYKLSVQRFPGSFGGQAFVMIGWCYPRQPLTVLKSNACPPKRFQKSLHRKLVINPCSPTRIQKIQLKYLHVTCNYVSLNITMHHYPSPPITVHHHLSLSITTHHFISPHITTHHYILLQITIHHYTSLPITTHHYPSLSITIHYYPSLSITTHHYPSLPITTHHYPSLSITIHHYHCKNVVDFLKANCHHEQWQRSPLVERLTYI